MKILITGTHFTPAAAVIEKLLTESDVNIVYVGRRSTLEGDSSLSVESRILPKMGVKFIPIMSGRFVRNLSLSAFLSLLKIPVGFIQAFFILLKEKPDKIVSFGGYTAVPIIVIGWLLSIPILIHEQGLKLGLANRISSIFADKIALSFVNSGNSGKKVIVTGNPLREEIIHPKKQENSIILKFIEKARKENKKIILVTGGNQGSHIININFEKTLEHILKKYSVIHITGESKYKDYDRLKTKERENYIVYKWINSEFGFVLKNIDLVITRAGINTLQEIEYFKKPIIVIPIPNKEQTENAKYFHDLIEAEIISQKELSPVILLSKIETVLKRKRAMSDKGEKLKGNINESASSRLALEILLLGRSLYTACK